MTLKFNNSTTAFSMERTFENDASLEFGIHTLNLWRSKSLPI